MLTKIRTCTATLLLAAFMVGCATPYQSLPVRTGTVTETQQSLRKVFQPSAGGAAAGAAVGVATANQYPQISLTGSFTRERLFLGPATTGLSLWSLGASVSQSLFDGGSLRAKKRGAEAAFHRRIPAKPGAIRGWLWSRADT